jgi:hypothetical protein
VGNPFQLAWLTIGIFELLLQSLRGTKDASPQARLALFMCEIQHVKSTVMIARHTRTHTFTILGATFTSTSSHPRHILASQFTIEVYITNGAFHSLELTHK